MAIFLQTWCVWTFSPFLCIFYEFVLMSLSSDYSWKTFEIFDLVNMRKQWCRLLSLILSTILSNPGQAVELITIGKQLLVISTFTCYFLSMISICNRWVLQNMQLFKRVNMLYLVSFKIFHCVCLGITWIVDELEC